MAIKMPSPPRSESVKEEGSGVCISAPKSIVTVLVRNVQPPLFSQ